MVASVDRLEKRIEVLTVTVETLIDALQVAAMDLEAGLEGEELEAAIAQAQAVGKAAKEVLGAR